MFMSPEEVAELTDYERPSAQIRWLEAEGISYRVSGNGRPKVLREVVLSLLGSTKPKKKGPQLRLTGS